MRLSSSVGREAGTRNPSSYVELRRVEFTDLCLASSTGKNFGQKKSLGPRRDPGSYSQQSRCASFLPKWYDLIL